MREILLIAFQHLRDMLRGRGMILQIVVMPIVMVIFIGSVVGGSGLPTGLVIDVMRGSTSNTSSTSDDALATKFVDLLRAEGKKQYQGKERLIVCDLASSAAQPDGCQLAKLESGSDVTILAQKRLEDNVSRATVVLPVGFSADLNTGKNVTVSLNTKNSDPRTTQAIQQQIETITTRLSGTLVAARSVTERLRKGDSAFYDQVFVAADSVWAKEPVQITEAFSTTTGTEAGTGFGQSTPGIGAMWVMTLALVISEVFISERKQGTLQRLMVLPVHRWQILAGKLLGHYLLCLLTFGVLLVVGTVFGVNWGDPLGVILIVLLYTLTVTAMGLWFSTIARTEGQSNGLRQIATMTLSPLGGAWWTLTIVPEWMRTLGQISPIYWSQDAFTKMIFYGATVTDILPSIVVLSGFTAVFFILGLRRFRYE